MHRPKLIQITVALGYLLSSSAIGNSADYYVAKTPQAADNNPGDARRPWRSLSAATARAQAGDTIIVGSGDYRDEDTGWGRGVIPILRPGRENAPLRLIAATAAQPIVLSFLLKAKQHIYIEGFEFRNPTFDRQSTWRDMPEILRQKPDKDSPPIDYSATWEARQAQIEHQFATYFSIVQQLEHLSALDLENCQEVTLRNNKIVGFWAGIQCRRCERLIIESNQIWHCVNGIYTWQPAPALAHSIIRANTITQSLDNGIDVREQSHHVLIENNTLRYSGRSHISLLSETSDCTIRGNDVRYGGYYSESMQYPGSSAINVHSSRQGIIVEGNFAAYQLDLTNVDGNGIILDLMKDGASVIVRNNIAWRNAGAGLNTTLSPNALIHNNAFIENGYETRRPRSGVGIKLSRDQDTGQTIINNLFVNNRSADILGYQVIDKQKSIDHNLYFANHPHPLIWDGYQSDERAFLTLEAVRSHTPWEQNGIFEDPLFCEPPSRTAQWADFRLRSNSPAIGRAARITTQSNLSNIGPALPLCP